MFQIAGGILIAIVVLLCLPLLIAWFGWLALILGAFLLGFLIYLAFDWDFLIAGIAVALIVALVSGVAYHVERRLDSKRASKWRNILR